MRARLAQVVLGVALAVASTGPVAQALPGTAAAPTPGAPPAARAFAASACSAGQLRATYTLVAGSNATGHVEYLLTVTDHSAVRSCTLPAPIQVTLLGGHGQRLPTSANAPAGRSYSVVLAPGQWAQADTELSPDLSGPGEPTRGPCEPTAHALAIDVRGATVRAPMDPTPVCQGGAIEFQRLRAVPRTPACSARQIRGRFQRDFQPFDGMVTYTLTLRNQRARACHTASIVAVRLLGPRGRKLTTRVRAGVSSPYTIPAHQTETAIAMLHTRGGGCEPTASRLRVSPGPGAGSLSTAVRPPIRACDGGLIGLSSLFRNG